VAVTRLSKLVFIQSSTYVISCPKTVISYHVDESINWEKVDHNRSAFFCCSIVSKAVRELPDWNLIYIPVAHSSAWKSWVTNFHKTFPESVPIKALRNTNWVYTFPLLWLTLFSFCTIRIEYFYCAVQTHFHFRQNWASSVSSRNLKWISLPWRQHMKLN
jgi:hypothetical protein